MWMPIPEGFWMLLARGWTSQYGTAEPGSNVGAEWMGFSVELREPKYRVMPRSCRLTATQSPELGIRNQNCLFWQPNSVDFPVPAGRGLRGKLLGYTIPCTQMAVSVMCPSHAPFTSFAQCSLNHRVPRLPAFTWNHLLVSKQSPAEWEAWAEAEEPLYGPASARNALWLQWAPPGLQPATGPDNDTGSSTKVCRHCMVSAAPSDLREASWFYLQLSNLTAGDGAGIASAHGKFQPCVWLCSSWGCCEHGDLSENFAASIITAVTRQLAQTGAVWANRVRLVRVAWYLNSTAMRAELGSKHTVMERQGAGWGTAKYSMADCKQ